MTNLPFLEASANKNRDLDILYDLIQKSNTSWCESIYDYVLHNLPKIRNLGKWPEYIDNDSILSRIPLNFYKKAPGFDAGLAVCMGIIPEKYATLSAKLHANYSTASIEQVKEEFVKLKLDGSCEETDTEWWLAMCSVCREGKVSQLDFIQQIYRAKHLADHREQRLVVARDEFLLMTPVVHNFFLQGKVPIVYVDGHAQGAYFKGYEVVVTQVDTEDSPLAYQFFISTYREEGLGLDGFKWSDVRDKQGRPCSGPVHGSKQFVKCASYGEVEEALNFSKLVQELK